MFDSRSQNPVLGRKLHVESEFQIQNAQILHPQAKIEENQFELTDRFYFHGNKQLPPTEEWKNNDYYFGCADGSPMDIDS